MFYSEFCLIFDNNFYKTQIFQIFLKKNSKRYFNPVWQF